MKIECAGCGEPMSFGASECSDCGTHYRYADGKAIAVDLEPDSSPVPPASSTGFFPPRGARPHVPASPVRPKRGLALVTMIAIVAVPLHWVIDFATWGLVEFLSRSGSLPIGVTFSDHFMFVASLRTVANGLVRFGAWLSFMLWMRESNRTLRALGVEGVRYTPAACIYLWLIPFVNLVGPYAAMAEIWRASRSVSGPTDRKRTRATSVVAWWWGSFLLGALSGGWSLAFFDYLVGMTVWVAGLAARLLAAVLAVWIVWTVQRRLEEKAGSGR